MLWFTRKFIKLLFYNIIVIVEYILLITISISERLAITKTFKYNRVHLIKEMIQQLCAMMLRIFFATSLAYYKCLTKELIQTYLYCNVVF